MIYKNWCYRTRLPAPWYSPPYNQFTIQLRRATSCRRLPGRSSGQNYVHVCDLTRATKVLFTGG